MAKPFENPANAVKQMGMSYTRAAMFAAGTGAVVWYLLARRDTRKTPFEELKHGQKDQVLRPEYGTTQQVGTNRENQQYRTPPPTKKTGP